MARENHTTNHAPKAPDYLAWHVTQKGEKAYWNKVSAAWVCTKTARATRCSWKPARSMAASFFGSR